jgi:hypothetical protein
LSVLEACSNETGIDSFRLTDLDTLVDLRKENSVDIDKWIDIRNQRGLGRSLHRMGIMSCSDARCTRRRRSKCINKRRIANFFYESFISEFQTPVAPFSLLSQE